jgi:nicotinamidase-related amidase
VKDIVGRAARLAEAFRERGLPVVLVNVSGAAPGRTEQGPMPAFPEGFDVLLPELGARPGDILVTKRRWGAFIGTDLDGLLRQRGVTQVLICGISTSAGVESTARCACELGYNVALVVDAMTDRVEELHRNSVERVFPRLGETDTTDNVLKLLSARR